MSNDAMARKVAIVLCLNDRFVAPARTTVESIKRCGGALEGVTLVILTTGLAVSSVDALEESASRAELALSIRTVSDISELGSIPSWAVSTCLRLYIGELCHDFERILYLDSDMLILSALAPLIDLDLGERTGAAVINHPPLNVMRVAIRRSQRGTIDGDAPYFNAGVLLIDVERWKRRCVGQQSRAFLSRFPKTRLLDQDALNIALVNDWCQLDKEWNTPAGPLDEAPMFLGLVQMNRSLIETVRQWERAQRQPKILHFQGQPKPWEIGYPWPELAERYHEYVLPAFGPTWPSTQPNAVVDRNSDQKVREFQRVAKPTHIDSSR
jgi:lipopolysaccharide biosynthesis glycosyltransferase